MLWKEAHSALKSGKYRDAQTLFDGFIKRYINDDRAVSARVYIGVCDYKQGGRTQRALDAWSRVVSMELLQQRASPALLLALEQLVFHYRSEKNTANLKRTLDQLIENFPDDPITIREVSLFAQECLENRNWREAADVLSRVEEKLSFQNKNNLMLARAMSSSDVSAAMLIKTADVQLTDNSIVLAVRLYEEALKREPTGNEKLEAMTKFGWCLYLQEEYQKAEKLWQNVISTAPHGNEWRGRSRWHMIQLTVGPLDMTDKAIKLCEEQAKEFPNHSDGERALFVRAWLYWTEKKWAEALQAFEELCLAYPEKRRHAPIQGYMRECEENLAAKVKK